MSPAHFSLPGEAKALRRYLAPLPEHRVEPVLRFLTEVVGACPECDGPITRIDSRCLVDDRLLHVACAPTRPSSSIHPAAGEPEGGASTIG